MKYIILFLPLITTLGLRAEEDQWKKDMISFRSNLLELAPYAFSKKEFGEKKNKEKISKHLKQMVKTGHKLPPDIKKRLTDEDPSISYISVNLRKDLEAANESFLEGKYTYSQSVLKSAINRCSQCHSQNYQKTQIMSGIAPEKLSLLTPAEQAELLIALRNFNKAKELLETQLKKVEFSEERQYEIENLVQKYVVVGLRTNVAPKELEANLKAVLKKKNLPKFINKKVSSYIGSLDGLGDIKKGSGLDKARELISRADKKKDYTYDVSGMVESLEASQLLHQYLKDQSISKKEKAESYYFLGRAYQSINEPSYWDMHESYFSRCVQTLPKTQLARSCFKRYRDSVEFRHSGSAGTFIPLRIKFKLSELKQLSGM